MATCMSTPGEARLSVEASHSAGVPSGNPAVPIGHQHPATDPGGGSGVGRSPPTEPGGGHVAFAVVQDSTHGNVGSAAHVLCGMNGRAITDVAAASGSYVFSSQLMMSTTIHGCPRTTTATTLYRVRPRASGPGTLVPNPPTATVSVPIDPNQQFFTTLATYNTAKCIVPQVAFDFAAIVERLASVTMKFALWGSCTIADLCASKDMRLRMLDKTGITMVHEHEVYLPPHIWWGRKEEATVIAYAACGAGSAVVIDHTAVDDCGRPQIANLVDGQLALACYDALVLLGQLHDYAGVGSIWAYAFTRGIHKSATVVAHTDEGGYVRDVLRRGAFPPPRGTLIQHPLTSWSGLPLAIGVAFHVLQDVMMSCALSTAAAVALADPTVTIGADTFPQVLCIDTPQFGLTLAARPTIPDTDVQPAAARLVAEHCGKFCDNYCYMLTKLFGFGVTDKTPALHLRAMFNTYKVSPVHTTSGTIQYVSRHLIRTGHYWYWIEPTSILTEPFSEMPAAAILSGPRVLPGKTATYQAWPGVHSCVPAVGASGVLTDFRAARRYPALDYLRECKDDGLAYIRLANVDPNVIACSGIDDSTPGALHATLQERPTIASLLWKRGDARVNAPAEFLVLDGTTAFLFIHDLCVTRAGYTEETSLPWQHEIADWTISYTTTTPKYVGVLNDVAQPKFVRQQRGAASHAFNVAMRRLGGRPLSKLDWIGPSDGTYMLSMLVNEQVRAAAATSEVTEPVSVGEVTAAIGARVIADTKYLAEPAPGSVRYDNGPTAGTRLKSVSHTDPKPPRGTMLPSELQTIEGIDSPGHALLTTALPGYTTFTPHSVVADDKRYTFYAAQQTSPDGGAVPSLYIIEPPATSPLIIGTAAHTGSLLIGEPIYTQLADGSQQLSKIKTDHGNKIKLSWWQGARRLRQDELGAYFSQLTSDQLQERYCVVDDTLLPRVVRDEQVVGMVDGDLVVTDGSAIAALASDDQ